MEYCMGMMTSSEECEYNNNRNMSTNGLMFSNEDFMAELLNSCPLDLPDVDDNSFMSLPFLIQESEFQLVSNNNDSNSLMSTINLSKNDPTNCLPVKEFAGDDDKRNNASENPKKRSRAQGNVQKNKKSKKSNNTKEDRPINNHELSSEDDSNSNSNNTGSSLNGLSSSVSSKAPQPNAKTRASRGAATDPQSLYARKRRERINERLRILQNIVPNGTKVDISTMLEEAVEYVKFLQLQIKMLSSDDHWMYAPLAYNGMNLGLHHLSINNTTTN